jgi:N-acetylneuraminate synthase
MAPGSVTITIDGRTIGPGQPTFIVAEISANHGQDMTTALRLVEAAKEAGADAVKVQTYTADTLTIDCDRDYFRIKGTLWAERTLHALYREAAMPWEWHAPLQARARQLGMTLFSTPFDFSAVDLLERLDVPAYKIASFELVDIPLLRRVARTGKPVIVSTGMATLAEIDEAVRTLRGAGATAIALLKCCSAYPAPATAMNLQTIAHLATAFSVPIGLSDHTLGVAVPVAAVALGACIVEKHFTLSRTVPTADAAFSLEPGEFASMVDAIRTAERAVGDVSYTATEEEAAMRIFRRSLFVVRDMHAGEVFTNENVRAIRPAHGLHTRHLDQVLGCRASRDISRGTPLSWDLVGGAAVLSGQEALL